MFGITGNPKHSHKPLIVKMLAATVSALKRARAVLPEEEGWLAPKGEKYKQKTITRGCDGYIESFVCEIDRSQSRHMFCWCGSGSGSHTLVLRSLNSARRKGSTIIRRRNSLQSKIVTYCASLSSGHI